MSSLPSDKMDQFERQVRKAFKKVKEDMVRLQAEMLELSREQETIMAVVKASKRPTKTVVEKTVVKKVSTKPRVSYVAAKEGKKFHKSNCPYAKNIKPKSKVVYKTKNAALNSKYKACKCV